VVAAADAVEAGPLRLDRLAQEVVGRELLVGAEVEVAHRCCHYPFVLGGTGVLPNRAGASSS
jgi:hypothetical protein